MKQETNTKQRSSPLTNSRRVHILLDEVADRNLTEATIHFETLYGASVSHSLIIRRALRRA